MINSVFKTEYQKVGLINVDVINGNFLINGYPVNGDILSMYIFLPLKLTNYIANCHLARQLS